MVMTMYILTVMFLALYCIDVLTLILMCCTNILYGCTLNSRERIITYTRLVLNLMAGATFVCWLATLGLFIGY